MSEKKRKAGAMWKGDLKSGSGHLSTENKALFEFPYSFSTRFENSDAGTNPEELIAAAHAGCYSMALASTLAKEGYNPLNIDTRATCTMSPLDGGGFEITKMDLHIKGEVDGIDKDTFTELVEKADHGCPVSNLLRNGLKIEHHVTLV